MVEHYLAAGDQEEAALFVLLAAEEAEQGLALDRAADMYSAPWFFGTMFVMTNASWRSARTPSPMPPEGTMQPRRTKKQPAASRKRALATNELFCLDKPRNSTSAQAILETDYGR